MSALDRRSATIVHDLWRCQRCRDGCGSANTNLKVGNK